MSKTVKIILGLVAVSILICGIGAVVMGTYGYQFTKNIAEQAPATRQQAEAFAKTVDQSKCLPEVIKRHQAAVAKSPMGLMKAQAQLSIFFNTCLLKAKTNPAVCRDAPGQSGEILKTIEANKSFAQARCSTYKYDAKTVCRQYVQMIPTMCHQLRMAASKAKDKAPKEKK